MAANLYQRAPVAPFPTLFTTAYPPVVRRLRRQNSFTNGTITTSPPKGPDCANFNGFKTCSSTGAYGGCVATAAVSACNCNNGLGYLGCLSSAISTSSCWGSVGIADWDSYQRDWFQDACPKPPASVIQELPQPTKAPLELAPIVIITPPSTIATQTEQPPPITQPTFTGGGQLLTQGDCASTSYTLVSAGDVVYYAAFIGCMADRPSCCPWSVALDNPLATAGPAAGGINEGNRVAGGAGRLPIPANGVQALLAKCPDDYYSVSSQGMCCPTGYYKFTTAIQAQTPCFSNLRAKATPPPLTAGLAAVPTDTRLPTSAILNVAWAMGYNVSDPDASKPPLSKPAAIGVGVGVGAVVLLLIGLTAWVCVRVRRRKAAAAPVVVGPPTGGEGYTDSAPVAGAGVYGKGYPSPPPPVSPVASGSPEMASVGAVSPSGSPPPGAGTYAPVPAGYGHQHNYSDAGSAGGWTTAPGQQGGQYAPPLPMQYRDRYGGQQQQMPAELQEQDYMQQGYGQQEYQGPPSPPPMQGMQQEYHPPYSELPPQEYQGPRYGGGQQQGPYDGWR
ncbi:hypothetical protein QBC39DRAFT_384747 [Podospora conica]|nr:hypothetical protein QBC39DRAFT_384747 [Schizothecium conicum]